MTSCNRNWIGLSLLALALASCFSCTKTPDADTHASQPTNLPFHQESNSPADNTARPDVGARRTNDSSQESAASLVPFKDERSNILPAGTLLTVRLESALSSVGGNSAPEFTAIVDTPVVVEGQTLVRAGTRVHGQVESARVSEANQEVGYVRLALDSMRIDGRSLPLHTASLFARGAVPITVTPTSINHDQSSAIPSVVQLNKGRRLTFRLAVSVSLAPETAATSNPPS